MRYDWYGCPIPSSWTPPRQPDPPLSRTALALAARAVADPPARHGASEASPSAAGRSSTVTLRPDDPDLNVSGTCG